MSSKLGKTLTQNLTKTGKYGGISSVGLKSPSLTTSKGLLTKTNAQGQSVLRNRTKLGLVGAGGVALFTPLGGDLVSGAVGQASENIGNIGGSLLSGLLPMLMPLCVSSASLVCFLVAVTVLMNFM